MPSNPCHHLVFTHKEQIPRGKKRPEKTKRRRLGSQVKRKATRDNITQNTGISDIEKIKIYKSGPIKM